MKVKMKERECGSQCSLNVLVFCDFRSTVDTQKMKLKYFEKAGIFLFAKYIGKYRCYQHEHDS